MDSDYPMDIPDASLGDFSEPVDDGAGDFNETADGGLQDTQQDVDDSLNWDDSGTEADESLSDGTNDVTSVQEQQAVSELSQIDEISPESWSELDETERLQVAQDIEDTMANIQGRPAQEVVVDPNLEPGTYGGYDGNCIRVSEWSLQSNDSKEFVDTIVHEGRHAYQDYAVQNPGFDPNEKEVAGWAENFNNYLDPQTYGQEAYASQPVEADAWNYGSQVASSLFGK